jgi:hypothetical protein
MSNTSKIAKIRLTATVIDTDGRGVDGWVNRGFSGDFEVYSEKDQAEVYIVELDDEPDHDAAIEAAIEDLIGAIDSFDGGTAYAADAQIGTRHGMTSLLAAHVELEDAVPYRRAVIAARTHNDHVSIPAYLPGNYKAVGTVVGFDEFGTDGILIEGKDDAGWTLDEYVLPRLASGLHFGRELEDGELHRWLDNDQYTPFQTELTFEVIAEMEYDPETDTLTEVN